MPVKITAVASPKPGQGATLDIPQDVKDDVDGLYDHLRQNPGTEGFAEFEADKDSGRTAVQERDRWLRFARAYATSREAGALKFRQLPSKHLPENQIRFSLTADVPANGERKGKK
jgi:hypothetical protein